VQINAELTDLAEVSAAEAARVLANARRHLARAWDAGSGRLTGAVNELEVILSRTAQQ
jgi:hypothetical protein